MDGAGRGPQGRIRFRGIVAGLAGICLALSTGAWGQVEEPPEPDAAAQVFAQKCIGCHTLGGGPLSGPDLIGVAGRPRADLEAAIIRMEKSVGPMTEAEVALLADLLQSPDAASRVEAEHRRASAAEAATLEPADAAVGRALFHGTQPLARGGLACAACHRAEGRGGTLAVPLEDAFQRMGYASLVSASEQPAFPAMKAVYAPRPVTKQEAVHIVKYLESLPPEPAPARSHPAGWAGAVGALGALAAVGMVYRHRPGGTVRARLVRESLAGTRRVPGRKA